MVEKAGTSDDADPDDDTNSDGPVEDRGSSVDENIPAEEELAKTRLEKEKLDIKNTKTRRRVRAPLALTAACVYALLATIGVGAAFTNTEAFDNLLKLYAIMVPVLTAVAGGAVGYYFNAGNDSK